MTRVAGDVAINVSADVGPLVTNMGKGESSVDRFGKTATRVKGNLERLNTTTGRFGAQLSRTNRSTGAFGRGVQNAAFQVGDFAVQVGGGVDASRALAQQLPQLLGGFGMLGAVLGAAVAIIVPLRTAMQGLADDGQDMTRVFGTLEPVAKNVAAAMKTMSEVALDGAELVVNNIDRILSVGATAAAFFAGKWVAGMVAARVATFSFSASLVALRAALIRTGIGALVVGAGELVYQFTRLVSAAGSFGQAVGLLGDVAREVLPRIGAHITVLTTDFRLAINDMQWAWAEGLGNMLTAFGRFADSVASMMPGFMGMAGGAEESARNFTADMLSGINDGLQDIFGAEREAKDILSKPIESIERIRDLLAGMKEENITLDSIFGNLGDVDDAAGGGSKKPKGVEQIEAYENALNSLRETSRGTFGALGEFMQQFAGKSRAAAIAAIGIQKGLSIAQIIANTAAAQMRALAELGPIAGPPMAAKIGFWGKAQAALVAATGLAQAASGGGGRAGGAIGGGGDFGGAPATSQAVAITLNGSESATYSKSQVRDLINAINEAVEGGAIVRLA